MTALDRLLRDPETRTAFDALTAGLSPTDLRSLLLAVAEQRATTKAPTDVLRQFQDDRFCATGTVDAVAIAQVQASTLAAVAGQGFDALQLSPVVPLATSSAFSEVPQNNVVSTMRMTEVLSDPTNVLALEAALRRRSDRSATARMTAVHRVVRAQPFAGPISFAHFSLLGLVSAGRDEGHRAFEVAELENHLRALVAAARSVDAAVQTEIAVSDHSGRFDEAERLIENLAGAADRITLDPDRVHGRGYYQHLCAKVFVRVGGERREVGDAGTTDWTQQLLGDRKERLVISGMGLDRLIV